MKTSAFIKRSPPWMRSSRFLSIDLWKQKLNIDVYKKTEEYWKKHFREESLFDKNNFQNKFYLLSMFPYPSGNLHMGHVRVYTVSDALARFHRMNGKNVFLPMGWDAFGLPAENAAFERQIAPDIWTKQNIDQMKKQFKQFSISFDWSFEINTCDPKYYRWTQYIFLKMYEAGLVYQKAALINWDPVDETVLADEQVDKNGYSWRSGAKVEKLVLKQWFIRTTKFAKDLREGLDDPNLENWEDIVVIQKNWIGNCNGYSFDFKVQSSSSDDLSINVWIQDPLLLLKAEFIVVKPNSLMDVLSKDHHGVERKLNFKAVNPFTDRLLPIYVSSNIRFPFKRDVYVGIPSLNETDKEFAKRVNHEFAVEFQLSDNNAQELCEKAKNMGIGGHPVSSHLNDWLISRQRYWGTPIPIIHCPKCGIQPVPYEKLPVILPSIPEGHQIDKSLSRILKQSNWRNTSCPKCGGEAYRETDTMDTFVDSSWYYLRYVDHDNELKPFDSDSINQLTPVDLYVGGKEHAVLHLYYARFVSHFLHSIGLISHREPFQSLLCQGKVRSKTYKNSKGRYFKPEEIVFKGDKTLSKDTKEELLLTWEKMSKSKFNGIEPECVINKYGIDTTRLFLLYEVPPKHHINWNPEIFTDVLQWQYRLWLTIKDFLRVRGKPLKGPQPVVNMKEEEAILKDARNTFLGEVTHEYRDKQDLYMVADRLQALTVILRKPAREVRKYCAEYERCLATFLIMLAPLAPHFTSTLWYGFTAAPDRLDQSNEILWSENVTKQKWPKVDPDHLLPVRCRINMTEPFEVKRIESQHLAQLTIDETYKCASESLKFQEIMTFMTNRKLINIEMKKYEGCKAMLFVSTEDEANSSNLSRLDEDER